MTELDDVPLVRTADADAMRAGLLAYQDDARTAESLYPALLKHLAGQRLPAFGVLAAFDTAVREYARTASADAAGRRIAQTVVWIAFDIYLKVIVPDDDGREHVHLCWQQLQQATGRSLPPPP